MIRTLAFTKDKQIVENLPLEDLQLTDLDWYWVDFNAPTKEEATKLEHFSFHPIAVKDCLHFFQRPKLSYYDDHTLYVLHALKKSPVIAQEVDLIAGDRFVVTFHYHEHKQIDEVWERMKNNGTVQEKGTGYITYKLMDKLVDSYFPIAQELEDRVTALEEKTRRRHRNLHTLMNEVFAIRSQLLDLRHTIWPMRDLFYRILNSHRLVFTEEEQRHYSNIYDHLEKLTSMVESSREMTADIRDNYLSIYSHRANSIMMTLTVITTIFMPLTFIAGIYGMNFEYMPELKWKHGYFIILGLMAFIGTIMGLWFRKKGWFD
ncbi:magnesium/cobalt transporter CorA [Paenactinomyces guangxiensis]|uniref:Magnesium transport protein CorA n=1 Tax=Paenactinomyces guangxiensis TaxID=1490290 RepID=A0A7W1WSP1_9BACL|nr:magnesium/cobalt transporter CorA [Paenactinomyces guangxiensis]MBA4495340.1 magnesium/cobalt transporter CorA [Paenactinomyces guangxiensis]MBH8592539.1 magnesium/cobalt transporter CorA [Paenactinomyces guangxiensis]